MQAKLIRGLAAALVLLAASAPRGGEAPTIQNPREAPARRSVVMAEAWRAGDDEGEDFIFGVIGQAVGDDEGNIYLLDSQLQQVFKFASDGEYLGLVSRKGEGPGEIDLSYQMRRWDHGTLGLLKVYPPLVTLVSTAGLPAGLVRLSLGDESAVQRSFYLLGFDCREGHLVGQGRIKTFADGRSRQFTFLSTFTSEGHEVHRFGEQASGYDFSKTIVVDEVADFFPLGRWALGRDGELYLAPERDEYLIEVRDPTGNLLRRIRRDVEPHRRSAAEIEEAKRGYSFASEKGLPDIEYRMSRIEAPLQSLHWLADQLWVETGAGLRTRPEGAARLFDVYDREGHLLEERSYLLPLDQNQDRLIFLDARQAVRIKAYRSADDAASAGFQSQRGEGGDKTGGDDDFMLEVILYRAVE